MNGRLANARAITKQLLCDNFRPKVRSDVTSGVDVEQGGMNVHPNFGDFRSNRSRDIRLPHFVLTTPAYVGHHIRAKRLKAFCLKTIRDRPYVSMGSYYKPMGF